MFSFPGPKQCSTGGGSGRPLPCIDKPGPGDWKIGRVVRRLAEALMAEGDFEAARDMYVRVVADSPSDPLAVGKLAELYLVSGNLGRAAIFYARLARLSPGDPAPHLHLAELHIRGHRFEMAETHFTKALELAPGSRARSSGAGQSFCLDQAI